MAGLGFSAAYFFDPAQGRQRRQHVGRLVARVRRSSGIDAGPGAEEELPRIGGAEPGPRANFVRAARV
jgi:hypothetical protein